MKEQIEKLIGELKKSARENENWYKHGSPLSSLAEDVTCGQVAEEQRRIIKELEKIIEVV